MGLFVFLFGNVFSTEFTIYDSRFGGDVDV